MLHADTHICHQNMHINVYVFEHAFMYAIRLAGVK